MELLVNIFVNSVSSKYQAIRTKYSSTKLMKIALHDSTTAFIAAHSPK